MSKVNMDNLVFDDIKHDDIKHDELNHEIPQKEYRDEELTKKLIEELQIPIKISSPEWTGIEICIRALDDEKIRIQYHLISKALFEIKYEQRDIIYNNVKFISKFMHEYEAGGVCYNLLGEKICSYKFWMKIHDHINLSNIQKSTMDNITEAYTNSLVEMRSQTDLLVNEERERVDEELNKLTNESNSLDEKYKRINFDVISVLGIFTGISFVMFGGLTMISDIDIDSNYNTIIKFLLIGLLMIDTVAVLLQYIKSIANSEVQVRNLVFESSEVFNGRPTYFIYANIIFIYYLLLIVSIEYRYTLINVYQEITKSSVSLIPVWVRISIIVLLFVIPLLFLWKVWNKRKSVRSNV